MINSPVVQLSKYTSESELSNLLTSSIYANKVIFQFDSVSDMKRFELLRETMLVETKGYYEPDDGGGAKYYIVDDENLIDDGGSVHDLDVGLKAVIICDNGVDCKVFGASKSDTLTESQVNTIFDNWTSYVNSTTGKYFEPTGGSTYRLYKPLYIRKSFIGINRPKFMLMTTSKDIVVSATEKTPNDYYNFNVKAVMGVNPTTTDDNTDRFTLKGFQLLCTNTDDTNATEYGVYFPLGNGFLMEDIIVIRPLKAGFIFKTNYMAEISRCTSLLSNEAGFIFQDTFTSLTVKNCWAHVFKTYGFNISGCMYSTFQDLATDSGNNAIASYAIGGSYATNLINIGTEETTSQKLLSIGDYTGTISGVYALLCEYSQSVISLTQDSQCVIENIYIDSCTAKGGTTPYSFYLYSPGTGENYNVTFNVKSKDIDLDGYTASPFYDSVQGRFRFNIKDVSYDFYNNLVRYDVRHRSVPDTPTSFGYAGELAFDGSYLYICVVNNTWRRVSIATW